MRTTERLTDTEQIHRLVENLTGQLARGREWATPGVQAALQRAVAGLDTGVETASPRLQTVLRRVADELAGGVETLTPRVQEQLKRVGQRTSGLGAPAPVEVTRRVARRWWWAGGFLMAAAATAVVWRSLQSSRQEPVPSLTVPETDSKANEDDPDLAAGRM